MDLVFALVHTARLEVSDTAERSINSWKPEGFGWDVRKVRSVSKVNFLPLASMSAVLHSRWHRKQLEVKSEMPNLVARKLFTAEELRNSPSRGDGMSDVLEADYRRKTCLFIKAAGKALDLWVPGIRRRDTYMKITSQEYRSTRYFLNFCSLVQLVSRAVACVATVVLAVQLLCMRESFY